MSFELEQIAYYRARAGEYDEWHQREGRYDRGVEANTAWQNEIKIVERALKAFHATGDVLEMAGGTGWWTQRLARSATTLTVVDAAPETLALNEARVARSDVEYVEADLFSWQPDKQYDVVFFSFWLSHVPPEKFVEFWEMVRVCLKPSGRVFFLDSRYAKTSTAEDHQLDGPDATTVQRRLNDGREYRIVKVFYQPDNLTVRLVRLGWNVSVQTTPHYFVYGEGRPV